MAKNLVIVESPTKVKTIKKFLGTNYDVVACNGHVRDLPKSQLGIDVENDFEPKYITIRGKGEILSALRKAASKADKVYLATDPDREGEAIAWHLSCCLNTDAKKTKRISFNEITKNAVKTAIKAPRDLNTDLVDEQQARRCLDRLVGYEISPILWKKIKRGLSAGRVQSAALRLIADREDEIAAFVPEEYWTLILLTKKGSKAMKLSFYGDKNGKLELKDEETVDKVIAETEKSDLIVTDLKKGERIKRPPFPFTTSTLQQEAAHVMNFSTSKTMRIAQQLYEGVEIKGKGTVGLISYLRTDSTRISEEADKALKKYVAGHYGKEYVGNISANANANKQAQDAHEAIRPTDPELSPVVIKDSLSRDQFRLYQMIWKRTVASRMSAAKYETFALTVGAGDYVYTASSSNLIFEGYKAVYSNDEEKPEKIPGIAALKPGDKLTPEGVEKEQHFTQPPAHFTEATLVRAMEELGIGRPSTYAPTISLLQLRHYVSKEKKKIYMTELGEVVNNMMKEAFPDIVDVRFTANMESLLDDVGEGKAEWKSVVRDFWPGLEKSVAAAEKELEHVKVADQVTDVICENCGRNMVLKYGPYGQFLACPGFPECRNTKPFYQKTGKKCPKCGADVVIKRTKKGRRYFGCENYPDCDYMSWKRP